MTWEQNVVFSLNTEKIIWVYFDEYDINGGILMSHILEPKQDIKLNFSLDSNKTWKIVWTKNLEKIGLWPTHISTDME